jgi:drug/metabolite transporter (DMT)-like permease
MWAILALATALLTSFNPIHYKRILRDTGAVVMVWGVIGLALPLLAFVTFALSPLLPQVDRLFVLATLGSASLNAIAPLASARSLKLADASLVTPLLSFSPVFTVILSALFLGETPEVRGLVGVGLVLIGTYWLNRGPSSNWLTPFKAISNRPGVGLVLLAGLL